MVEQMRVSGVLLKLTKFPILPIFGLSNRIHAIHISDLCLNINNIIKALNFKTQFIWIF